MSTAALTIEKPSVPRRVLGAFHRLYRGETKFDFVRRRRWWYGISAIVIAAGAISLAVRGLNLSIEFVGGESWEFPSSTLTVDQVKAALGPHGLDQATITTLSSANRRQIQVEAKLASGQTPAQQTATVNAVAADLAHLAGIPVSDVSTQLVGATWGNQVTHKAIEALIVFFIVIAAYISIFFEWKMALAAIVAVIHDILVTLGIYSLTGFSVTPDTVVAFLTILGYSLYDTIVVFDRVRDNVRGLGATGKLSYTDVVNLSMNQTLARSINTSLVAILPILSVLIIGAHVLGAVTLQNFGLALFIGLLSGAYSSIFIASPLLAQLKERETRYRSIREKLEARGTTELLLSPAAVAGGALGGEDGVGVRRRGQKQRVAASATASSGRLQPGARGRSGQSGGGGSSGGKGAVAAAVPAGSALDDDLDLDDVSSNGAGGAGGDGAGGAKTQPAASKGTASGKAGSTRPGGASRPAGQGGGASRPAPRPRKKKKR
jgi:preprotein translocase subunit SecF